MKKYIKVDDDTDNLLLDKEKVCELTFSDYVILRKITRLKDDAQNDAFLQPDVDDFFNEDIDAENYQPSINNEPEHDEFDSYKGKVEKFEKELSSAS